MKQHKLKQGSPEWHAHRRNFRNASDAPAMMGCSPYKTREQLLHETFTGISAEVGQELQRRFDDGHRFEAMARPLAEEFIGQKLYPVVGSEGNRSASFDGLTMDCKINYEHKSLNKELRAAMVEGCTGADLPLPYRVQMEQQHMVSGAEKTIFVASKWAGDDLVEERHCWYTPDPDLAQKIEAGWAQFEIDLAAYTPPAAGGVVVAEQVQALPAVLVKVEGEIIVTHNFDVFETALRDFLEHRLIRAPKTDQDFADLDVQIKAMKGAEAALESSEVQMLAQVQTIDQAKKTKDMLLKLTRENRLMAEKLLASEKERRRTEIVLDPARELASHIAALNERLGKPYMPPTVVDFAQVIRGMRSLSSMEDAVATRLAAAKIDANATADRIQKNREMLRSKDEAGEDWIRLFPDFGQVCTKSSDDFQNLLTARVAAETSRVEAEREKIRAEEKAKADQAAALKSELAMKQVQGIQQQVMIATLGRAGVRAGGTIACIKETLAETEAWPVDEEQFGAHLTLAQAAKDKAIADILALLEAAESKAAEAATPKSQEQAHPNGAPMFSATTFKDNGEPIMLNADGTRSVFCDVDDGDGAAAATPATPASVPAANVVPMRAPAPAAQTLTAPTLKLGVINERLAPIQLTAAGLVVLGFEAAGKSGSAVLYHERDFTHICAALINHVNQLQAQQAA